ncbi:hemerythrin domain-containing protein [Ammoniphilus sp. CFH 90114]|uniref:hemerythrin domain-containing protein n=1 Tax=Ammoniphilus sp. CFH 90114 TaxID=2493665 RepID=UPI00100F19BB|nr:hemerythrin domain-containing protein [Ammoniphilus sp. CFH 90114]RXT04814.1 hemerythrin domain-containing protein [Ammoniphilus sp. CFH 90114]
MIENTVTDRISLLIGQHEELKSISNTAQKLIFTATRPVMKELISQLFKLTEEHVKQEEEILLPLLKEMYYSDAQEISGFIIDEHNQIRKQLMVLMDSMDSFDEHDTEWAHSIQCVLINQLAHIFEEEQVLFPLIKKHFSQKSSHLRHLN